MKRNLTLWRNDSNTGAPRRTVTDDVDRIRELETENALLRARIVDLNRQLDERPEVTPDGFAATDEDGSMEAFEAFLAESDPHLDRVQRFLLG